MLRSGPKGPRLEADLQENSSLVAPVIPRGGLVFRVGQLFLHFPVWQVKGSEVRAVIQLPPVDSIFSANYRKYYETDRYIHRRFLGHMERANEWRGV